MYTANWQGTPRKLGSAALALCVFVIAACEPRADPDAAPGAVGDQPPAGGVQQPPATGDVQIDEVWPLEAADEGSAVMATGTVTGTRDTTGFFLRTDNNRVFFVTGNHNVNPNQTVRVVGEVRAAETATFQGWERDLLGRVQPEWDVSRTHYIAATSVTPM